MMEPSPPRSTHDQSPKNLSACLISPSPSPLMLRLWQPAAQRNVRNQWSRLAAAKDRWLSSSANGMARATTLVNSHLSQEYLPAMELGAIKDMPGIRDKAHNKLACSKDLYGKMLLSSYKDMIRSVSDMINASLSMRCYLEMTSGSPLVRHCQMSDGTSDSGDGGGVFVFGSLTIHDFENLADEVVDMFVVELSVKRLIVMELLSISFKEGAYDSLSTRWLHELYDGEFRELIALGLQSEESSPLPKIWQSFIPITNQMSRSLGRENLQFYLTTWLANANIRTSRINEIFALVEDVMHVKLLLSV